MIRAGRFHVLQFLGPSVEYFPSDVLIVQRIVAKGLLIAAQCLINRETVNWQHVCYKENPLVRDTDNSSK